MVTEYYFELSPVYQTIVTEARNEFIFSTRKKSPIHLGPRILFVPGIHLSNYMKALKKPDSVQPITVKPILNLGGSGGDDLLAVLVVADTRGGSPVTAAHTRTDTI